MRNESERTKNPRATVGPLLAATSLALLACGGSSAPPAQSAPGQSTLPAQAESVPTATPLAEGRLSVLAPEDQVGFAIEQDGKLTRLVVDHMQPSTWPDTHQPVDWTAVGNTKVQVFGRRNADGSIDVDQMKPVRGAYRSLAMGPAPVLASPRRALVIQITFDGAPPLGTYDDIKSKVAAFADDLSQASFGQLTMNYDVVGAYDVKFGSCDDKYRWLNDAKAIAEHNGINLANYSHFSLAVRADCGYGGLGEQPGAITWIAALDTGVFIHEFGHNFGLFHASTRSCTSGGAPVSMSDTCTMAEYGNGFDSMGNAYAQHQYNGIYKAQLGWIPPARIATATGAETQTFTIAPQNVSTTETQLVQVQGPNGILYSVDFRQPARADNYSSGDPAVNGVLVYAQLTTAPDGIRSQLLDMTPGSNVFADASLTVGQSYDFYGTNIGIQVRSVGQSGAVVVIGPAGSIPPPDPVTTGTTFKVVSSGMCLTLAGPNNGDRAIQRPCNGALNQQWTVTPQSDGAYLIKNVATGRCLDLFNGDTADGSLIAEFDCWAGPNQHWKLPRSSDGSVSVVSIVSDKCLDDFDQSTADGAQLGHWSCNGGANQQFLMQ